MGFQKLLAIEVSVTLSTLNSLRVIDAPLRRAAGSSCTLAWSVLCFPAVNALTTEHEPYTLYLPNPGLVSATSRKTKCQKTKPDSLRCPLSTPERYTPHYTDPPPKKKTNKKYRSKKHNNNVTSNVLNSKP